MKVRLIKEFARQQVQTSTLQTSSEFLEICLTFEIQIAERKSRNI